MEFRAKARRWGSSLAVVLPKPLVETKKIKENEDIIIDIRKPLVAKDVFGMFPRLSKKSGQQIKDEMRAGW